MPILYVAATPIGNLSDASPRLLKTLGEVSLIAAEDTRVTGNLLRHFGISTPMTSLHRHNEAEKAESIVERMMAEGINVALVSDAGTPAISDPGFVLVQKAIREGIEVLAIAGPSAVAAAISVSGMDTREFAFYGFLPRTRGDLRNKLLEIARGPSVAVIHESPHRIIALMEAVAAVLPGCEASVSCDLTKLHEKTIWGSVEAVVTALHSNPKTEKGEYCVVLNISAVTIPKEVESTNVSLAARLVEAMMAGVEVQEAIADAVANGARKNEAKRAVLDIQKWILKERTQYRNKQDKKP